MRTLICGDSYCNIDSDYPGLHWSEKILNFNTDFEVINLSHGGCSNALIAMQLLQGLKFHPDFVILSFTSHGRYEFDNIVNRIPRSLEPLEIANYVKDRYTTNKYTMTEFQEKANQAWLLESSENFEKVKNYLYICFCLSMLKQSNINFCFSLGGFEYQQDYTAFLNSNYLTNIIQDYQQYELSTNLWYHGQKAQPCFHVDNESIHELFANECIERITRG